MTSNPGSKRLHNVDALRGIAAFLVMVQHLLVNPIVLKTSPVASEIILGVCVGWFDVGKFGVLAFFAISGYVIPFSFKGDDPIRRFAISRFFRLYPAYWVSIAAFTLVLMALGHRIDVRTVSLNLTMVQRLLGAPDLIGVYWTLFVELIFYGLCCVAAWFGVLKNAKAVLAAIAVCSGLVILTAAAIYLTGRHLPVAPLFGLNIMFLGTLFRLAQVEGDKTAAAALPGVAAWVCVAQVIGCYLSYVHNTEADVTPWYGQSIATVAAVVVFTLASRYTGAVPSALLFLGATSYALYLMHEIVMHAMEPLFRSTPASAAAFILAVAAVALFVSWLVYRFVEQPSIALGKRVAGNRTARRLEA